MDLEDVDTEANRLAAATIYLMTCHARSRCPRVAAMVEAHLRALSRHAHASTLVKHMAGKLAAAWVAVRRHDEAACSDTAAKPPAILH